ncbi:hypothetical protein SK128_002550 [Halocaridina rubra]|uniref:Uncharacterized protein n=1 Tax=Halocaridina rubra TaxID=373956 RepID=A0AAN8XHG3_HALRR
MAGLPLDTAREAVMKEDLTRFWSTMSRKYEWDRPHYKAFSPSQTLTSDKTWEQLNAQDKPVASTSFLKDESGDGSIVWTEFEDYNPESDLVSNFSYLLGVIINLGVYIITEIGVIKRLLFYTESSLKVATNYVFVFMSMRE